MKDFIVKNDSWHYRFNYWVGVDAPLAKGYSSTVASMKRNSDFCSYFRMTLGSILKIIIVCLLFGVIISSLSVFGYLIVLDFMSYGYGLGTSMIITILSILSPFLLIILAAMFVIAIKNYNRRKRSQEYKQPGLFTTKYRSWKEKICPKVVYED